MEEADRFRTKLSEAGVYIVQAPIFGNASDDTTQGLASCDVTGGDASAKEEEVDVEGDKRWKGQAARLDEWKLWFEDQMRDSQVTSDDGLYVGLRMDGRVRASGRGMPPWFRIANELPPLEGLWKGFGDGFDGPVY